MFGLLIMDVQLLFNRGINDVQSRKKRSRATEETEDKVNYFQGFIGRLCPHVVICKDKKDQNKYEFHCHPDPNGKNDRTQTSGFVRIQNTTCQKWSTSKFDYEQKKVIVKCTNDDEGNKEVVISHWKMIINFYIIRN